MPFLRALRIEEKLLDYLLVTYWTVTVTYLWAHFIVTLKKQMEQPELLTPTNNSNCDSYYSIQKAGKEL